MVGRKEEYIYNVHQAMTNGFLLAQRESQTSGQYLHLPPNRNMREYLGRSDS